MREYRQAAQQFHLSGPDFTGAARHNRRALWDAIVNAHRGGREERVPIDEELPPMVAAELWSQHMPRRAIPFYNAVEVPEDPYMEPISISVLV